MAKPTKKDFEEWWRDTGSGIAILESDDVEMHTKKIARLAWLQSIEITESLELKDMFVTITERDCYNPFDSNGAIVSETYTAKSGAFQAIERAERFDGRYGRVWIARLELINELEEFIKISKNI